MNQNNPNNSPAVNTLFVLRRSGFFDSDFIDLMIEELNINDELRNNVDAQIIASKYNENKLQFTQRANRDSCPGQFDLSPEAYQLAGYLTSIMTQQGLVAVNKKLICTELQWNRTKQDKFSKYIDELIKHNIIERISQPKAKSHVPAGYKVNQNFEWIKRSEGDNAKQIPRAQCHDLYKRSTIQLPVNINGKVKKMTFGTVEEIQEQNKGNSDGEKKDDSN